MKKLLLMFAITVFTLSALCYAGAEEVKVVKDNITKSSNIAATKITEKVTILSVGLDTEDIKPGKSLKSYIKTKNTVGLGKKVTINYTISSSKDGINFITIKKGTIYSKAGTEFKSMTPAFAIKDDVKKIRVDYIIPPQKGIEVVGENKIQKAFEIKAKGDEVPIEYDKSKKSSQVRKDKLLVMLVEFNDIGANFSDKEWHNRIFGNDGKTINTYYKEVSSGNFQFEPASESYNTLNDGVIKVKVNRSSSYIYNNEEDYNFNKVVKEALTAADSYIDFSSFDTNKNGIISRNELHIAFLIAKKIDVPMFTPHLSFYAMDELKLDGVHIAKGVPNYDADIWGYNPTSGGYTMQSDFTPIGTLAHELGHSLGLPDLYEPVPKEDGIGFLSLMDSGPYGTAKGDKDYGLTPTHLDPWSKTKLGFITPTIASSPGDYTLYSVSAGKYNILKIPTSSPSEYFLLENRQLKGFDLGMVDEINDKDGGVLIWHIDEKQDDNGSSLHPRIVDIEGKKGKDITFYKLGGKNIFGPDTFPNSNSKNGTVTGLKVTVKSKSSDAMVVNISGVPKDTTPPAIITSIPKANVTTFPIDKSIMFGFNEDIRAGKNFNSITLTDAAGRPNSIDSKIYEDRLIITPVNKLNPNSEYIVSIPSNAIVDGSKNAAKSFTVKFTTSTTTEESFLRVIERSLVDGGSIATDGTITLKLNSNIQPAFKRYTYIRIIEGTNYNKEVAISKVIDGNKLEIRPLEPLKEGVLHILYFPSGSVVDDIGNFNSMERIYFTPKSK